MDELIVDNPVAETVTQESTLQPSTETPNEPIESNLENQDNADEATETEFDEVDYNGNKYKVPKDLVEVLKKADQLDADYTRKTMAVAEMRKAAESQLQQFHREQEINSELTQEVSQLTAVESRLSQFQNVNWQQWQAQDPQAAQAGMAEMMQLRDTHSQLYGHVEGRKAEISAIHEQRSATMISDAIEQLSKPDPDKGWAGKFDVAVKDNLTKFGKELGYTDDELAGTNHPLMIKTLNLARIGYESLKKQRAAVIPQKVVANPVPQVGAGKSRSTVDPDKLSNAEWNKLRNIQAAKAGYR